MALIVAALQQLGKHKLLKERHRARIKPDPLGVLRRELFREHHIALSLIHIFFGEKVIAERRKIRYDRYKLK